tara:strand:+ start:465 stop:737 length:273 start_codon:yes stop_codon:yes gene_type:complete
MNHKEILEKARKQASKPENVVKIETLHQNLAHMTVALKEVETRLLRVVNKTNRHRIENSEIYCVPLAKCVEAIKEQIFETHQYLKSYELF